MDTQKKESKVLSDLSNQTTMKDSPVLVDTVLTSDNIIDLITASDVFTAYHALAQLSGAKTTNSTKKVFKRGVIQQIQTLSINVGGAIVGAASIKTLLVVQWYAEFADDVREES